MAYKFMVTKAGNICFRPSGEPAAKNGNYQPLTKLTFAHLATTLKYVKASETTARRHGNNWPYYSGNLVSLGKDRITKLAKLGIRTLGELVASIHRREIKLSIVTGDYCSSGRDIIGAITGEIQKAKPDLVEAIPLPSVISLDVKRLKVTFEVDKALAEAYRELNPAEQEAVHEQLNHVIRASLDGLVAEASRLALRRKLEEKAATLAKLKEESAQLTEEIAQATAALSGELSHQQSSNIGGGSSTGTRTLRPRTTRMRVPD